MSDETPEVDLRGVPCPINWARAKVRLEAVAAGERLAFLVDDPRSLRDLPRAAEASGHVVLSVTEIGSAWRMLIEK